MPVFISHRTADDVLARRVYDRLTREHQIRYYLDDLDKEAHRTSRITALIVDRLTSCSNLLALLTRNTKGSWWVPFKVGVRASSATHHNILHGSPTGRTSRVP